MKKILLALLPLAMAAIVLATVLTIPAAAQSQRVTVRLADGTLQTWVVNAPDGSTLEDVARLIPQGQPIAMEPVPANTTPTAPAQPAPEPKVEKKPKAGHGERQKPSGDRHKLKPPKPPKRKPRPKPEARHPGGSQPAPPPLRTPGGAPTRSNPTFTDALPGPSTATGVPNFIIRKFRVPIFLLPIYQAAGTQYGIRWEILAAINEIETDYGRNLNVSSAGALGWMQFMPSTWKAYGT